MTKVRHQEDGYVLRRVVSGKVLMSSFHPKVGPVFWDMTQDPKRNLPDQFGLTTYMGGAQRFQPGYVQIQDGLDEIWASNQAGESVIDTAPGDDRGTFSADQPSGDFEVLAKSAGVAKADIANWFRNALWIEIPAPPTIFFLRRYDGSIGYRDEWTEALGEAHKFDEPRNLPSRVLGELRRHGRLVDVFEADVLPQALPAARDCVNHALEADVAWTLHRHQWGAPEIFRKALRHAGTAGWIFAAERGDHVSGHISAFPQLLDAFEMGRMLYMSVQSSATKKEV